MGDDNWRIPSSESILGAALVEVGQFEEGIQLLQQGYEGLLRTRKGGEADSKVEEARARLDKAVSR